MRRILLLTFAALMLIFAIVGCGTKSPTTSNEDRSNEPGSKFEQLGTTNDVGQ
jgi:predicted small lipoprotein YifL